MTLPLLMAHFAWPFPFLQSQKVVTLPLFPPPSSPASFWQVPKAIESSCLPALTAEISLGHHTTLITLLLTDLRIIKNYDNTNLPFRKNGKKLSTILTKTLNVTGSSKSWDRDHESSKPNETKTLNSNAPSLILLSPDFPLRISLIEKR